MRIFNQLIRTVGLISCIAFKFIVVIGCRGVNSYSCCLLPTHQSAVASDKIMFRKISLEDFYQSTHLTSLLCLSGPRPLRLKSAGVSDVMMRVCYYGWNLIILLSNALLAVTVIKQEHYFEMSDLNCILTVVGVCANESGCVYFSARLSCVSMW